MPEKYPNDDLKAARKLLATIHRCYLFAESNEAISYLDANMIKVFYTNYENYRMLGEQSMTVSLIRKPDYTSAIYEILKRIISLDVKETIGEQSTRRLLKYFESLVEVES